MTRPLLAGLLALCVLSGCAARSYAVCPDRGGAPWREVTSAHFKVRTNLGSEAAQATVRELEKHRRAVALAWGARFDPPGQVEVVVLRNAYELHEFGEDAYSSYTVREKGSPVLVLSGQGYAAAEAPSIEREQMFALASYLQAKALKSNARWFSQGLSEFLSTTKLKADDSGVTIGHPNPYSLAYVRGHGRLPMDTLWAWEDKELTESDFDAFSTSSWLWVHYLFNRHPDRFANFQGRLAQGEDAHQAWVKVMGDLDMGELDRDLSVYVSQGRYGVIQQPLPSWPTDVQERPLTDADVHVMRARLWRLVGAKGTADSRRLAVQQELAEALESDPANTDARALQQALASDSGT